MINLHNLFIARDGIVAALAEGLSPVQALKKVRATKAGKTISVTTLIRMARRLQA